MGNCEIIKAAPQIFFRNTKLSRAHLGFYIFVRIFLLTFLPSFAILNIPTGVDDNNE